jgi:hypothetical protein
MAVLNMSDEDLRRIRGLAEVDRGGLPAGAAAKLLGLSERRVW